MKNPLPSNPPHPFKTWMECYIDFEKTIGPKPIEEDIEIAYQQAGHPRDEGRIYFYDYFPKGSRLWMLKIRAFDELLSKLPTYDQLFDDLMRLNMGRGGKADSLIDLMELLKLFMEKGLENVLKTKK